MSNHITPSSLTLHAALSVQPIIYRRQERDYNEYMHLHTFSAKESRLKIMQDGLGAQWKRVNGRLVRAWAK